ncbi:arsenicals resistance, partial [Oleoguttula sp. CCFEE 5521]
MASLGLDPDRNNTHQSPEKAAIQSSCDPEKGPSSNSPTVTECSQAGDPKPRGKESVYKGLGWLDRLLALRILLAIIVGILIGNYVDGAEATLQEGKFVQVSVPIGLAGADEEYCAILVAVSSILQMVLTAPLAIFFLRVISGSTTTIQIEYGVVATSVGVFLGIPLGAAVVTRLAIRAVSASWYQNVFLKWIARWSLIGLLYTILVLFASQGWKVVHQIV